MKAVNKTKNSTLAENLVCEESLIGRLRGLLGKKLLTDGEGMLLKPCYQIHTWFMKFPIDVLFLDEKNHVSHLIHEMKPFRISGLHFSAKSVLELPFGKIEKTKTEVGDSIIIED